MVTVRQTKSASCRVTGGSGNWPSSEDERRSFSSATIVMRCSRSVLPSLVTYVVKVN